LHCNSAVASASLQSFRHHHSPDSKKKSGAVPRLNVPGTAIAKAIPGGEIFEKEPEMKLRGIRATAGLRSLACAAAGVVLPVALVPESWAEELLDAAQWVSDAHIMGIAAAANALAMIP
jgi:hypothetical protein